LKLQQILASSCRQRILLALSKVGETHFSNLVRMTNSTYYQVHRNLEILSREGMVDVRTYGRMKMIRLCHDNPKTEVLVKALHLIENVDDTVH